MQESTRYCNYAKDKFGNEITFIIPRWIHDIQKDIASTIDPITGFKRDYIRNLKSDALMHNLSIEDRTVAEYMDTLEKIERCYLDMLTLDDGTKLIPQQARQILPNALKTELIMTGTINQWQDFFRLRCAPNAHPDARYLAEKLKDLFIINGYL